MELRNTNTTPKNLLPQTKTLPQTGNVKVIGEVVSLTSRTGAFFRCPECRRTVKNGICMVHGEVEPIKDLRIGLRMITRNGEVVLEFSGEKAQKTAGITAEDAHSRPQPELWNYIENRFVGKILKAECFYMKEGYLYARETQFLRESEKNVQTETSEKTV